MSYPFDGRNGPVLVNSEVTGPAQTLSLPLVLDTGATASLLSEAVLLALGFDLAGAPNRVRMTTGSRVESVPRVILTRFSALGRHRIGFPVLAHTLPASASVSGLIGLDFLRDGVLTLDFRTGQISLA